MKKLLYILSALLILSGCSKKDNISSSNENNTDLNKEGKQMSFLDWLKEQEQNVTTRASRGQTYRLINFKYFRPATATGN